MGVIGNAIRPLAIKENSRRIEGGGRWDLRPIPTDSLRAQVKVPRVRRRAFLSERLAALVRSGVRMDARQNGRGVSPSHGSEHRTMSLTAGFAMVACLAVAGFDKQRPVGGPSAGVDMPVATTTIAAEPHAAHPAGECPNDLATTTLNSTNLKGGSPWNRIPPALGMG